MKPTFRIKRIPFQVNSEPIEDVYDKNILKYICFELTMTHDFNIEWIKERNEGRLAVFETNQKIFYISISGPNPQGGRNSYFQSVPTAFSIFLKEMQNVSKKGEFIVCIQGKNTNAHLTKYQIFAARMILSSGIRIVDATKSIFNKLKLEPFASIQDLILARKESKGQNLGNNSTFITDEGNAYHLYGKTFGANGKETTMLCFALMNLSTKPIRLFQILDNNEKTISNDDKESIVNFSKYFNTEAIEILDDTYDIDDFTFQTYKPEGKLQLRKPCFIYNLLQKTFGQKKCAICDCEVESLIQAAHIYGVAEIKRNGLLTDREKVKMATDGNNGLWLCMHHHKLFDSYQIYISTSSIGILSTIKNNNQLSFIEDSISENKIDNIYNTRETKEYFVKRELAIKEQEKWCNGRVNPKPLEEFYSSCNQISKVVATPTVSYGKK